MGFSGINKLLVLKTLNEKKKKNIQCFGDELCEHRRAEGTPPGIQLKPKHRVYTPNSSYEPVWRKRAPKQKPSLNVSITVNLFEFGLKSVGSLVMPPCLRIKGSVGTQALYSYRFLYSPLLIPECSPVSQELKFPPSGASSDIYPDIVSLEKIIE